MAAGWASPGTPSVELSSWPMVGRDDELALAAKALAEQSSVVLTGPAGVGKTRLAHEVLARAAGEEGRTAWVSATHAAASVPLGAFAHLVPRKLGRGRDEALRGIVAALHRDDGPLLIGVDDAHLLDDASATLVQLLVQNQTAAAVVTLRSGEPAPDSIVSLWKDGNARLVALQTLARTEVEAVVTTALAGHVDGATLEFLWNSSGGNALFLHELVLHGLESGALRYEQDLWRWPGPLEPGDRLRDLVAMRMGALADEEREALELIAMGQPLTVECVRELGVGDIAAALERRGLVVSEQRVRLELSLAHPLFGEVLRDAMAPTRRRDVELQLARAVEATGDGSPAEQFRIALWRVDVGDTTRPDQVLAASAHALELWENRLGERLARAALDAQPTMESAYLLAESLSNQNRTDEALEAFRIARSRPGPERILAMAVVGEAGVLYGQLSRRAEAEELLTTTLEQVHDPRARRTIEGGRAVIAVTSGSGSAESMATASDSPAAAMAVALDHAAAGRLDVAIRLAGAHVGSAFLLEEEFPAIDLFLRMTQVWAQVLGGHMAEAQTAIDAGYANAIDTRADFPRLTWSMSRGLLCVMRGLPQTAARSLREAAAGFELADRGFLRPTLAYLAMAAALAGEPDVAAEHICKAARASSGTDGVFGIDIARANAWIHASRGLTIEAAETALATAAVAADRNQHAYEMMALHDAARFGAPAVVADRLEELATIVDGELVDAMARHARGLANDDGDALDDAAAAFVAMTCDLFAAEASLAAAQSHRRQGKRARAFAAVERAKALEVRCEGARTPTLTWADQPADLTSREREVAELAAAGRSSRQIADTLGITTRTVDNLLGRVYAKLGIAGRQELSDLLGGASGSS